MLRLRPGNRAPVAIAIVAVALTAIGATRLPADLIALPGNPVAHALAASRPVPPNGLSRLLESYPASLRSLSAADRWFAVGHAHLMAGDPSGSAKAFANGLRHAPARGIAWAAYANALEAAGHASASAAARQHSIRRAPYDPRAVRLRR